jgi:ABC-type dipeptide/oligopeptide/nickel transport system permease subunit
MAIALLLATAAAAAGFVVTSVFGFVIAAHGPHDPLVRFLVTRHVLYAIPTLLLSLFSQSMVLFYFIGTGRLVKDEIAGWSEERRRGVLGALRRFKTHTSPPATFAMLVAIAAFVLGGWVHTAAPGIRSVARAAHLSASVAALAIHLWALLAEYPVFVENNRLMADPAAYAGPGSGGS